MWFQYQCEIELYSASASNTPGFDNQALKFPLTQLVCFILGSVHWKVPPPQGQAWGFPCGSAGEESACNVGHLGSIPGLGRSPEEGNGYPLQYSGLQNSMDCIVHGVTKGQTRLSDFQNLKKKATSFSLPIQIWISSRNLLTDTLTLFDQIPGQLLAQSSWHSKLTISEGVSSLRHGLFFGRWMLSWKLWQERCWMS